MTPTISYHGPDAFAPGECRYFRIGLTPQQNKTAYCGERVIKVPHAYDLEKRSWESMYHAWIPIPQPCGGYYLQHILQGHKLLEDGTDQYMKLYLNVNKEGDKFLWKTPMIWTIIFD